MTPDSSTMKTPPDRARPDSPAPPLSEDAPARRPALSLAELLLRSMDDEEPLLAAEPEDRERWDEDEGCFGG
jgi:hypothetical protein